MANANAKKKMNWFQIFMIFLVALVVAISLGLVIYYFCQNDETIAFKDSSLRVNASDNFVVEVEHTDAKGGTTIDLTDFDTNIIKLNREQSTETNWVFEAVSGGKTTIKLITNSSNYKDVEMLCEVTVGDGSVANPFFIGNADQLSKIGTGSFGLDKNYVQISDIDLGVKGKWTGISGSFIGNYNGANYTVANMTINGANGTNAGLFQTIGSNGIVKDLTIKSSRIEGSAKNAGILAGVNCGIVSNISVQGVSVDSTLQTQSVNVGAVVGLMQYSSTATKVERIQVDSNSVVTYRANGTNQGFVGGIVGFNGSGTISNSFSRAIVTGAGTNVSLGGIAGKLETLFSSDITTSKKANIVNSYSTARFSAEQNASVGGVVGYFAQSGDTQADKKVRGRLDGVYYLDTSAENWAGNLNGQNYSENIIGVDYTLVAAKADNEMKIKTTYTTYDNFRELQEWDFYNVWEINGNYPTIQANSSTSVDSILDPYSASGLYIRTQADLASISLSPSEDYEIDPELAGPIEIDSTWQPISSTFTGKLKGNGKTIHFNGTASEYATLFNALGPSAQVFDFAVKGVNLSVTQAGQVGVIAKTNNGLIQDVTVEGSITAYKSQSVGGLVGTNMGTINYTNTSLKSNVTINATSSTNELYVGGIAGTNSGRIEKARVEIHITNGDSSHGNGTGQAFAGGVSGLLTGKINKSQVLSGAVIVAENNENAAGGIAGKVEDAGLISWSEVSAVGTVIVGGDFAGGIVGIVNGQDTNECVNVVSSQVSQSTNVNGTNAAGLAGKMIRGIMENCASFATISGSSKQAGYAVYVEGYTGDAGRGKYSIIRKCFISVSFAGNGAKYAETASLVRATNDALHALIYEGLEDPRSFKIAGYIKDSIFDNASGGEYCPTSSVLWAKGKVNKGKSDEECKTASTFAEFDRNIWVIINGEYPHIDFSN